MTLLVTQNVKVMAFVGVQLEISWHYNYQNWFKMRMNSLITRIRIDDLNIIMRTEIQRTSLYKDVQAHSWNVQVMKCITDRVIHKTCINLGSCRNSLEPIYGMRTKTRISSDHNEFL